MCKNFNGKCILIGDLNAEESEAFFSQFLFEMYAKVIVKEPKYPKLYRSCH